MIFFYWIQQRRNSWFQIGWPTSLPWCYPQPHIPWIDPRAGPAMCGEWSPCSQHSRWNKAPRARWQSQRCPCWGRPGLLTWESCGGVSTLSHIFKDSSKELFFVSNYVVSLPGNANPDGDIMSKQVPFPKAYPWLLWSSMSMHVAAYPRDFTHLVAILDPAKNSTHW